MAYYATEILTSVARSLREAFNSTLNTGISQHQKYVTYVANYVPFFFVLIVRDRKCPALPSHKVINHSWHTLGLLLYSWQLPKIFNYLSQLRCGNENELEYHLFHEPHQRSEYSKLTFVSMFG